jgi:hypothetical protein
MELGEGEILVNRVNIAGNLELQSISPSFKGDPTPAETE